MKPPGADTVVVRYGDLSVKSSRVQRRMEERLVENLGALLDARGIDGTVEQRWTHPRIHADDVDAAADAATDAFGVSNASPALVVDPTMDAITDAVGETAAAVYDDPSATFAVDADRSGDHDFGSHDVGREAGAAVFEAVEQRPTGSQSPGASGEAVDFEPEVDLDDPDLTFGVEVRDDEAFVFVERREGPGGLPLGSQAPLVALVSGGIDSPVAAYEAMKRGSPIVPVYLDLEQYGGPDHRARALETVRRLADYAPNFDVRTRVVPAGDAVGTLVEEMNRGRMLSYRRFMYRVAEVVAERTDAAGIVTGEAIGQKSSQTTRNFAVTEAAVDLPVHRPLVTLDKPDITERARAIGTFRDSAIPAGCYRIAPDQVSTDASLDVLRESEPDGLLARAAAAVDEAELVDPTAPVEA